MAKKKGPEDFSDLLGLVSAGLTNKKKNNYQYEPHDKQVIFHRSQTKGRQFLGGNRSGKTVAGINEDIWWLTGRHPFIKVPPPPIHGRIVTVDFKNGFHEIIKPTLRQWLPPSDLVNGSWEDSFDGHHHVLTLANNSQVEFMSYEQELDKFAGVPRHFIHFDEEPPFDIFTECKARLVDYNGRWWMTMTPVEGMTWTYDEIYEKRHTRLIDVVEVDVHDNPNVDPEGISEFLEEFTDDERMIRGAGRYIAISGLVFKGFEPSVHVRPVALAEGEEVFSEIPNAQEFEHYVSLDHGFNNPTAIMFHAVHKTNGIVITYAEHYRREFTIEQHAEWLHKAERELREKAGVVPFLRIADPAIKQRSPVTGLSIQIEYSNHGINWALGAVKDVDAGLDKMNNYLRLNKWFILDNCTNLIKEMRKYKRGQYATQKLRDKNNPKEEPQKKDDHAIDSCRYFFSFMPTLDLKMPPAKVEPVASLLGAPTRRVFPGMVTKDPNFQKTDSGIYVVHDEYVGEW